jgi:predicted dehydrogenase
MRLLILGYSSVVRRRVLPAARALPAINGICIASRSHGPDSAEAGVTWFADYDDAIVASGADLVYVSGVNSDHHQWVARALEQGSHVAVDKPALPDVRAAEAMVTLARRRGRGLAEATVFPFHPQFASVRAFVAGQDAAATRVTATFSIPPLPPEDFRYRPDCGGGSLADLGPYAVAVNRLVFDAAPETVSCRILTRSGSPAVDTSFSVLMTHRSGGSMIGHFGFVTAYQNRLSLLTPSCAVDVDRIFTSAPDVPGGVRVRDAAGERVVPTPAADAFAEFLGAFTGAIARDECEPFASALLADAALLDRLRAASST